MAKYPYSSPYTIVSLFMPMRKLINLYMLFGLLMIIGVRVSPSFCKFAF